MLLGPALPSGVPRLLGGLGRYWAAVMAYQAIFLVWSALFFYGDGTGDYALLSQGGFEAAAAAYAELEVARKAEGSWALTAWLLGW